MDKKIAILLRSKLSSWKEDKRIKSLFLYILSVVIFYVFPINKVCRDIGYRISPWIFPHLVNEPYFSLLFLTGSIILFADAPFINNLTYLTMARSGKKAWYIAQLAYISLASTVYVIIYHIVGFLILFFNTTFTSDWGLVIKFMAKNGDIAGAFKFSKDAIKFYSPLEAMSLSFIQSLLMVIAIGMIIFTISLYFKDNRPGIFSAGVFVFSSGLAFAFATPISYKYFPGTWLMYDTYDPLGYSSKPHPYQMLVIIFILIIVLAIAGYVKLKDKEIYAYPEVE